MSTKIFLPDSYALSYSLDKTMKTFAQYKLQNSEKELLTDLIRLEKNNGYNRITGAHLLLRINNGSNWSKGSLTGLRPTDTPNFFTADLPVNGKKSLCVVKYNSDTEIIEIRVAPEYYPFVKSNLKPIVDAIIKTF